jgi:DNA-binding IclR family transcriptional regulator
MTTGRGAPTSRGGRRPAADNETIIDPADRSGIGRLFAVLETFSPAEPRLTLSEISRRSSLPVTTVHRLVNQLVRYGGLERHLDGSYEVGRRLWEIGSLAPVRGGLRELALPFMEDLYEATHANVQLAVREGFEALFVEKISGRESIEILTRVGGRLPLHATGVGKVLLAHAPPEIIDGVIARGLEPHTPWTITDGDELRAVLEQVRRDGFASTREEMTLGSVSVAAPVYGPRAEVVAALSVVVSARTLDVSRLAPSVRTAARGLSRRVAEAWDRLGPAGLPFHTEGHPVR